MFLIRFWRNQTKKDSVESAKYEFVFYLYLHFSKVFFMDLDLDFPDRIRIFWPIRNRKKSDPGPEKTGSETLLTVHLKVWLFLEDFLRVPSQGDDVCVGRNQQQQQQPIILAKPSGQSHHHHRLRKLPVTVVYTYSGKTKSNTTVAAQHYTVGVRPDILGNERWDPCVSGWTSSRSDRFPWRIVLKNFVFCLILYR